MSSEGERTKNKAKCIASRIIAQKGSEAGYRNFPGAQPTGTTAGDQGKIPLTVTHVTA